jgi:predicted alpha/beta superfamily hydrolase
VIGQTEELNSSILNEKRTLNIYLPEGYKEQDSVKYPVIYLLDGGMSEDFLHIVGLVQFSGFEWIQWLPKCIVVGIANTDRKRDFTFPSSIPDEKIKFPEAGHSDKFIEFLEQELQPFINKKFRCNGEKMLIGESLGGLLATQILFEKPNLFQQYLIVSPSLWWDNGSMLNRTFPAFDQQIQVYLAVGKEGLTPTAVPRVMEVDANVLADKLRALPDKKLKVYFDFLPSENHATIMHQAVMNAFRWFASSSR